MVGGSLEGGLGRLVAEVRHRAAEAGEVERLRGCADRDRPIGEPGLAYRWQMSVGAEREIGPDLVAEHDQVVTLGNVGDRRKFSWRCDPAGRIVGL